VGLTQGVGRNGSDGNGWKWRGAEGMGLAWKVMRDDWGSVAGLAVEERAFDGNGQSGRGGGTAGVKAARPARRGRWWSVVKVMEMDIGSALLPETNLAGPGGINGGLWRRGWNWDFGSALLP